MPPLSGAAAGGVLAILQARTSSSRLPGKVLKPLLGEPMLARQIERIRRSRRVERLIVATSDHSGDDAIQKVCDTLGIGCFRGSLDDVLDRFYQAARGAEARIVVRLTGDCPLADPELIDEVVQFCVDGGYDYVSNALDPTFPDGLDCEAFRFECLQTAWTEATLSSQREHVTPYLYSHPERFRIGSYRGASDHSGLRWTVDEPQDFALVEAIYSALYPANPAFSWTDVLSFVQRNPQLVGNASLDRNEGYAKSLLHDSLAAKGQKMGTRYRRSEELLERAEKTIPLGSQTFSKSRTQYPFGASPYFIQRGRGSHVWDVDGNEYIDFINSLAAVTLGYNDPDVTQAVRDQLEDGVIFSLAHPIEMQVAEKLVEMVPCAEMVRFGKNGSDATSGAIRLARAYTGRDHVAVCGYHGWQDWYIGSTTRNRGVPEVTQRLTHKFMYNDIASLHTVFSECRDQIAAVILEPMNITEPAPGFLEEVRELTTRNGALLVFDETITGFRFALGGAQELFGVTPDLATFGKGLANGYPISAVAGKERYMQLMKEIFFSFTFGGEALSLAAALATMKKLQREPVIETLSSRGKTLIDGADELIRRHGVANILRTAGNPTWTFLLMQDAAPYTQWQLKTLFMQEMLARGVLTLGTHNMCYAHSDQDVAETLKAYDAVFPMMRDAVDNRRLDEMLHCSTLQPLFAVR
jgi:glutamate-1-semialdehyde aminotransferase/spore coat polysaccharide biosynthesis protein SpsF (cytidylyltransferase family)